MGENIEFITSIVIRAIVAGTPLFIGTLGNIITERSGIMNLGVEGMMAVGAISGFAAAMYSGSPWIGLAAACFSGMTLAFLHALISVKLRANQVVSGLAMTMLGLGLSSLAGKTYVGIPLKCAFSTYAIPLLSDIPVVGNVFFNRDPVFYLVIILALLTWFTLYYTKLGIEIRSAGENPLASETMGVNVERIRTGCTCIGGAFAGMAGGYLSLVYLPTWIEGMTSGRGWIIVALTIFSFWNPFRAIIGAYTFGAIFVLQYFFQSKGISPNLLLMFPYIATLVAMVIASSGAAEQKICAPAALGIPYFKNEK
ncbi:MAG: ABC transporter permease [Candidatus Riflebacteria bacterium]|nr:ABC transporter permease [Candidatus Riflebacteria bacterium]